MRFDLYEGSDTDGSWEATLLAETDDRSLLKLSPYLRKTWSVEASTRDEAMQLFYDRMGWGHYTPFDDQNGVHVEVYGVPRQEDRE